MNNVNRLAKQFRNAIELARDNGDFNEDFLFWRFPRGCCGDASELLANFLLENNIRTSYVCGKYKPAAYENIQTHAWLITDDQKIIDITGDQFREKLEFLNYSEPIYIGEYDDFHKLFKFEDRDIRENNGLEALSSMVQFRLKMLYQKISSYL